jgi:ribosome maturation factor RimP
VETLQMATVEQLWQIVEPYLAAEGLELDDLELVGRGPTRTLRVVIDGVMSDGSGMVDLDRISEVSRALSRLLDAETDIEGPYQLEVSSPGLERKLTRRPHYDKSLGREIVVKTAAGSIRGVLIEVGEDQFSVRTEEDHPVQVAYADVVSARTVFRWDRAPKPGQPRRQP